MGTSRYVHVHQPVRSTKKLRNRKALKQCRKDLRNNGAPAEAQLWMTLKKRQLQGRKLLRRQHSIGAFIVDFYCPREKTRSSWMARTTMTCSAKPTMPNGRRTLRHRASQYFALRIR